MGFYSADRVSSYDMYRVFFREFYPCYCHTQDDHMNSYTMYIETKDDDDSTNIDLEETLDRDGFEGTIYKISVRCNQCHSYDWWYGPFGSASMLKYL